MGNDTIDGGAGTDMVEFSTSAGGVAVDLSTGNASGQGLDAISGVEDVTGSPHDDAITGDAGANVLNGGAGADVLAGGAGDDALHGGAGTDTVDFASSQGGVT